MSIRLINGDCLEVLKTIPDASVDLVLCDLPYGVLTGGGKLENPGGSSYGQNACAWDIKIDLGKFWIEIKRILKNVHCPVIHFCTTKFGYELIKSNESWFRYDLVWDKQRGVSFLHANKMPMRSHEMIYVFSEAGAYYNRIDISGNFQSWKVKRTNQKSIHYGVERTDTEGGNGKRCVLSIICNSERGKGQHPTQKPVDLYRWLIERYSPVGGTVLDPTFGSGNSVITARDMGRHAIGIEKDKAFYEKALAKITPPQNLII
jgi:DNA modification methylase